MDQDKVHHMVTRRDKKLCDSLKKKRDDDSDDSETEETVSLYEPTTEDEENAEEDDALDNEDEVEDEDEDEEGEAEDEDEEDEAEDMEDDDEDDDMPTNKGVQNIARLLLFNRPMFVVRNKKIEKKTNHRKQDKKKNPRIRSYSNEELVYYNGLDDNTKERITATEWSIKDMNREDTPTRFKILQSHMDNQLKAVAINKLNQLEGMGCNNGEFHKLSKWMDAFVKIPFGVYRGVSVYRNQSGTFDHADVGNFLTHTKKVLDNVVYGHHETKDQMIRFLAQRIVNPQSKGSVIGIHGRPGVGKTTLVKDGICKALDIPFAFIPLGGASDGSFLEGHSYTYEGSSWGKIVDVIMKCGCMNPILYFDELDKVSITPKGEEIVNILIHLTDPGQNERFSDKYFMDVPVDLSQAIIIFTYNDDTVINPVLKDRMIRISVNDYTLDDKVKIAHSHLIPSLNQQFQFNADDVVFTNDVIKAIVNIIDEEAGVRNLRRGLELILSTLNLKRLLQPTDALMHAVSKNVLDDNYVLRLPFVLDQDNAMALLKRHKMTKNDSCKIPFMYT